jgi:uncharacterized sporulation protein YeaH/YhbH (DUF444 family)
MVSKIDYDYNRFRDIIRGRIKRDLRKFVRQGHMQGRRGADGDVVSIPLPQIELPRFLLDPSKGQGVGQGEGDEGGAGEEAGDQPGQHALEVEVSLEELASILGEELELPHIEPKGEKELTSEIDRYTGIRRVGPESLRHFKRTFRQALRRELASGTYDPKRPIVVPIREDRRYRSWTTKEAPESNAVIIHMMDVSGSMGREQKEIVRIEAFWIDTWLRSQYEKLRTVYIIHDAAAKEVDEHTFYHVQESGGTKISSAYQLCLEILDRRFPTEEWNIYPFHFSDGDNWGGDDTSRCITLLRDELLPRVNMFCYGQVKSAYGSGQFKKDLDKNFGGEERLITSAIPDRDGILDSIKDFLGKGH